jgi:hypothetical protein
VEGFGAGISKWWRDLVLLGNGGGVGGGIFCRDLVEGVGGGP